MFFPLFLYLYQNSCQIFEFAIKKKRKSNTVKYQGCLNNTDGTVPGKKPVMFPKRPLIIKRQRKNFLEIKKGASFQ